MQPSMVDALEAGRKGARSAVRMLTEGHRSETH
jgi:hypothetical protein